MDIRTTELTDHEKLKELYKAVAISGDGIARLEHEITDEYISEFLHKSIERGFSIVAENPANPNQLIGEIHAYRPGIEVFDHVYSEMTMLVHPEFQGKKIGRTLLTIFLEEIGLNKHDVGRVELFTRESNTRAIKLYQSMGFRIEGRFEMRIKTNDNHYEADIAMAWQNPNFEF
jgi:ribosomal protein S18 acetylase RimI-like enzyme